MSRGKVAVVISGGQSGVDRAALDAALACGVSYAGWCPKGGWAEDYPEPPGVLTRYPGLQESPAVEPAVRTSLNVRDSDVTLVVRAPLVRSRGTDLAIRAARAAGRPLLLIDGSPGGAAQVEAWLSDRSGGLRLNVVGPRASEDQDCYRRALQVLRLVL